MVLKDYLEQNKGNLKNSFYLLDAADWYCLINPDNNTLYYKKIKTGFLSKIKCAIVYVDEEELKKDKKDYKDLSLYIAPPKSALRYLINEMEENEIDGIMFNGHYFLSLEEIWETYNERMYDYFKDTLEIIKDLEDKTKKTIQYIRAFLMLPSMFTICFENDNSYAIERKTGYKGEVANTIYLFNSKKETEKFIKTMNLKNQGIIPQCCKNYSSVKDIVKDSYNYATIDGKHFVKISDLISIEKKILGL